MSKMLKFSISKKRIALWICFCMIGVFVGGFSYSPVCLAESAFNYLEIGRGIGATEYEYWVVVQSSDVGMTDLQIDTPWGEPFLASDYLPQGWQGEYVEYNNPSTGLEFEAWTVNGNPTMVCGWSWENPGSEWDALDTGDTSLTVFYSQESWIGSVDFSSSPIPTQVPVITYPSQGALDVELRPTFTWGQWINPDANKNPGIDWELNKTSTDENIYDQNHAPADSTSWTSVTELIPDTLYNFNIDFHYSPTVQVNGVDVTVSSYRGSNTVLEFTTTAKFATSIDKVCIASEYRHYPLPFTITDQYFMIASAIVDGNASHVYLHVPGSSGDVRLTHLSLWDDFTPYQFAAGFFSPPPGPAWEGIEYNFYIEGHVADKTWYITPGSIRQIGYPSSVTISDGNHPTITWNKVIDADWYVVRFFPIVNGNPNRNDLLDQSANIMDDGRSSYSYPYTGDAFDTYGTLAVAIETYDDAGVSSGWINRSVHYSRHNPAVKKAAMPWIPLLLLDD